MVGLEQTVVPLFAAADFGLASKLAVLAFLVSFGAVKALIHAPSWGWVVFANGRPRCCSE